MNYNDMDFRLSTTCNKCHTKYAFNWCDLEMDDDIYETPDKIFRVTKLITRCPGCGRYDVVHTYAEEL